MNWSDDQLEKLKEMSQWVCWTFEERDGDKTKPPIAPVDNTRYAKSNDSSTWGSYEDAVSYHEREDTDTEGIGFMLSQSDLVVGIDLDGCRHPETGELEPWASEIVDLADTYTEVSPSQTGLRLFAVGMLPEGRSRQKQERTIDLPEWVVEEKSAEIEVYDDVRYMTYTGDQLEGTPSDAEKRVAEIKQLHAEYVADKLSDGNSNGSETDYEGVDLSDSDDGNYTNEFGNSLDQIREWDDKLDKLLSKIEPAVSLSGHDESASEYDFSATVKLLYWRFSENDIGNILRRFRGRKKLKRDDYVKRTIANAKKANSEQCEPPENRNIDSIENISEAKVALDAILSLYENDSEREMGHKNEIWKAVGKIGPEGVDDYADRVADVLETTATAVEYHAELDEHSRESGPIVVDSGKTWYIAGVPKRKYELLNFELDVQSYLEIERGPLQAQMKATLETGESFSKAVEPKIFNRKERFDDEILGESFGTKFSIPSIIGKNVYVQDLLDALRIWVHNQDAPRRKGVHHMGLYDDELVIPGYSLRSDGWAENPNIVYLERELGVERRVQLPTDRDEFDKEDISKILETFPFTRDCERLLPVVGWFYAAPLRPLILDFSESGEFNHLNITGDTGSGKTTTLSYLWRCFGMGGEPFSVDMTNFARVATFSATNSLPLWFDEYKPSDIPDYRLDPFHDNYRKATRGAFTERGNADKSTESYKLDAPVVVSGEQSIQGPAERRRTIMTQFRTETTDAGTDTARAYKDLVGKAIVEDGELNLSDEVPNPEDHALGYYRFVTGLNKAEVKEEWYAALEYAHRFLENLGVVEEMDDLEIQGLQTVVFGYNIYRKFAESVGADLSELPTEEELDKSLEFVVERIGVDGKRKSHTDRFIELFGRAAVQEYVERGRHYEIVREGTPREEMRINLPRTFDQLSKYANDHGIENQDLLNSHSDYRDRFSELADTPGSLITCVQQNTPSVSKCTGILTVKAMNDLDFDRNVLETDQPIEAEESAQIDSHGQDPDDDLDGDSDEEIAGPPGEVSAVEGMAAEAQEEAATDGGEEGDTDDTTEYEGVTGKVREHLRLSVESGDTVTAGRIAGELSDSSLSPEEVEDALNTLKTKTGLLNKTASGTYEVL